MAYRSWFAWGLTNGCGKLKGECGMLKTNAESKISKRKSEINSRRAPHGWSVPAGRIGLIIPPSVTDGFPEVAIFQGAP
jgi:hypothetical protein